MEEENSLDLSDEQLLLSVADGNQDAFACLYDRHAARLYGLAVKLLKDRQTAADAVQDTFVKIWKNASKYRSQLGRPLVWMSYICRNRCIDLIRSSLGDRTSIPDDPLWIERQEPSAPESDNPLANIQDAQLRERIRQAMQMLPLEQRRLIEQAYTRGLSHTELAAEVGLPVGTVKSRIRLGMRKLRKHLILENESLL